MLATVYEIWDTVYITEISDLNACRGNGRWVYGTGFGACSEGKSRKCRGIFLVVVSDTVADAWKGIRGLRRAESFTAWIFRILANKCRRRLRQYMDKTVELPLDLAEDSRDICRDMDVRRAFAELSDEERMILAMNIFGGYTSREIGKALHMSSNTVRSKQSRALKKMEACLER